MPTFNKYNCGICKYSTQKVGNYASHCTSKSHLNKVENHPSPPPKKTPTLVCNYCNYTTIRTANMNRHCKTQTHLRAVDKAAASPSYPSTPSPSSPPPVEHDSSTITAIIKSIHEITKIQKTSAKLQKTQSNALIQIAESNLAMVSPPPQQITNNGTINNITNKFNLNVFLNEDCKDAPNFSDFIQNIQVEMADLDETGTNTLESGIKRILGRALSNVHATNRPIHCTDQKRKTLYVKENGEWEKDAEHESLKNGVAVVRDKQVMSLQSWTECHPKYNINGSTEQKAFLHLAQNATTVLSNTEMSRIIGNVATQTNARDVISGGNEWIMAAPAAPNQEL